MRLYRDRSDPAEPLPPFGEAQGRAGEGQSHTAIPVAQPSTIAGRCSRTHCANAGAGRAGVKWKPCAM